jgi:WD40 repeat protein
VADGDPPDEKPTDAAPILPTLMVSSQTMVPGAPPGMPQAWRYEITVEIARGGMGRVVEAMDTVLGRTVALKEVLSLDADTVRRFQRETRITARLEHPAIVPVHDAGVTPDGAPFYVMRKVGGRALEELVAAASDVPKRLALVPHIITAAQAIAHAHERGIVHRDIKPSNILVGDLGETIVIDWGLAKAIGEADDTTGPTARVLPPDDDAALKTRAGVVYGTPGFMAPEQLRGRPVDERCDVYALGATLYHLLARRPPHHHKSADAMMRAAVEGPPVPLTELVPTVPPELATIVDKALAHDATRRYQNAGSLAEDLQRYLTGQLVGSHQYTTRERLWRFYRRNRTSVTVAAVASIAILVGTIVAFAEIRGQRDRADAEARIATTQRKLAEEQREIVMAKARELTLTNARHASLTDPTRAVAMVKPLVTPELWRQARDVGAAARANGVAFSLPISKHTMTLELSRDGERALAAGDDGIVRLVDLQKRSAKEVFNAGGAVMARFADGERKIILHQGNRLWIVDTATGTKRELTATTAIAQLEVSGPLAYWVDTSNAVWRLDLAGGPPTPVELAEPVTLVMPSPDGRWIAFGGTKHLLLADRSHPTQPPEIMSEGVTRHLTWSGDSRRLAVQIDDEVLDINTQPVPQIFDRFLVGARFGLAYSGGQIFSSGPTGVRQLARPESKVRLNDPSHTLGVHEARGRVVISAKPQGEIVVLSEYGDHTLKAPLPIQAVATSPQGPWIVAAAEGMLLVWSLEGFEPRSFEASPPTSARFVTGDSMIVTYFDDSADWIDLRTHKETSLGLMPALSTVVASPDGAEAIAIDSTRRAWHVSGVGQPKALPGEVSRASFVDDTRYVVATAAGLRLDDQRQHTQLALLAHTPEIRDLATLADGGGWVAASFADGKLWRKSLGSGVETSLVVPAPLPESLPLALASDGTVLVGVGGEVRAWRADGRIESLASGAEPIYDVVLVEPTTVLALAADGTGHHVDIRARTITARLPVAPLSSVAANGSLVACPTVVGGVEVVDPVAQWRWPLATPQKGMHQPFADIQIAPDGTRVVALTQHSVVVWTLALPGTAEETTSWLDKLTNATAGSPSGPLTWR